MPLADRMARDVADRKYQLWLAVREYAQELAKTRDVNRKFLRLLEADVKLREAEVRRVTGEQGTKEE